MRKNLIKRIKLVAVIVCTFLIVSLFSPMSTGQEYTNYEPNKQKSYKSFDCDAEFPCTITDEKRDLFQHPVLNEVIGENYPFLKNRSPAKDLFALHEEDPMFVPGELIVKFRDVPLAVTRSKNGFVTTGVCSLDVLNEQSGVMAMKKVFNVDGISSLSCFYKLTLPDDSDILFAAELYEEDPYVEYAGPNYIMTAYLTPDDPYYNSSGSWEQEYMDLYGMHIINASDAWDIATGSYDVVVAVVDTGVDYNHEDIVENMWINEDEIPGNGIDDDNDGFVDNIYGADFAYGDGDPMDGCGHGTHCAGTIAAVGNNALGVVGVNWHAKIMAVKGLDDGGSGGNDVLADALRWAADNGAEVISNSWGPSYRLPYEPMLEAAVQYAYDAGCVIVFAAGNENDDVQYYCPANMKETISVAATNHQDHKAYFSNWGEKINVSAPGVDVLSLRADGTDMYGDGSHIVGDNYYRASGTSMACPHVAGIAALILSYNSSLSNDEVKEQIMATADNIDGLNPGYEGLLGNGRINAAKALPPEHNVGILSVNVLSHVQSNETIYVNATIINNGQNNETNVVVSFLIDEILAEFITIPFFERLTTQQFSFLWSPLCVGCYTVTINVTVPDVFEERYWDNEKSQMVVVGVQNIDTEECFDTIQEGIDDSDTLEGHCLLVPCGIYYENVVINKGISLTGLDKESTIIDGCMSGDSVVSIQNADSVNITRFTIRNGTKGASIEGSSCVHIINCDICDNTMGIHVTDSSNNNMVIENAVFGNQEGIVIDAGSNHNVVYHNSFNNIQENACDEGGDNLWDGGYYEGFCIYGGNWWSDYNESDNFSGPEQNISLNDGIGDTPYNISRESNIQDLYPLMEPWTGPLTTTIYVDDNNTAGPWNGTIDHPYQYIQHGVDKASDGHTVFVFNGTYYENVTIDTTISLIGQHRDTTIIDGGGIDCHDVIKIYDNWVNISGFTIQHSGSYYLDAGINIVNSKYSTITDTTIKDNYYGIYFKDSSNNNIYENNISSSNVSGIILEDSSENTIVSNIIRENGYGDPEMFGYGIEMMCSDTNIISGNSIMNNNHSGIFVYSSSDNNISWNTITDNLYIGISVWYPSYLLGNSIFGNTITNNGGYGIYLHRTCDNKIISGNNIINNSCDGIFLYDSACNIISGNNVLGNDGQGIRLKSSFFSFIHCHSNIICDNNISKSDSGIYLDSSWENTISDNMISENAVGIKIKALHDKQIFWDVITNYNYSDKSLIDISSENTIPENTATKNNPDLCVMYPIWLSNNNIIYHNNFINNTQHAYDKCRNLWNDSYPSGGSYWDDYAGSDMYHGPNQNLSGSDGIGDTPYNISGKTSPNQDRYPFMNPDGWGVPPYKPSNPNPANHTTINVKVD